MHTLLIEQRQRVWNLHKDGEQMAKDFVDKYECFIPKVPEVVLPDLSAERFWKQIQKRNIHKAGGFDGWRTAEVRELPCALIS
eukprot:13343271-Alexandrium_andersonii.AAC.1